MYVARAVMVVVEEGRTGVATLGEIADMAVVEAEIKEEGGRIVRAVTRVCVMVYG